MSYILDALRRADADRARGSQTVPDLHSQHAPSSGAAPAATASSTGGRRVLVLLLAAGALVAAVALGWWFAGGRQAEPAPIAAATGTPPTPAQAPPAPTPQAPAQPPVAQEPPPVALRADTSTRRGTEPDAAPAERGADAKDRATAPAERADTARRSVEANRRERPQQPSARAERAERADGPRPRVEAARNDGADRAPVSAQTSDASPRGAEPAAPRAAESSRTPTVAELPEALRSQLPPLAIGGSVYSPDPGGRMVVINGQVWSQGQTLPSGVQVEQIGQRAVVMRFKGTRFSVPL